MTYDEKLELLYVAMEQGVSKDDWADLVDELDLNMHEDTLRKAWSVSPYSGYRVMQHYKEKMQGEYCSDDEIKRIEDAKWELQKERYKVQDQRRELNKIARDEARFENLKECLIEKMEDLPSINLNIKENDIDDDIEASLILSDLHIGLEVDNIFNFYNIDVAKERLSKLCKKVINKCQLHRVDKINIELAGDLLNGVINVSNRVEQEEDIISSVVICSEIISQFINEIKGHVKDVVVYAVVGNHSRVEKDKKASLGRENFERLVFEYIKLRVPTIKLIQNGYEDFLVYKVKNKEIVVTHGDKENLNNAKMHFCNILNRVVNEIHFGHIHHYNIKNDNGTLIVVNGSLISTDNYAMGLRCNTRPSQVLRVYSKDDCTYNLELG